MRNQESSLPPPDLLERWASEAIFASRKDELLRNMHLFRLALVERGETQTQFWGLKARNEFRILKKLVKLGHANVYRLSKSLKDAGHYSTILRALRRMERKGLVRSVIEEHKSRGQKTYEATLLGEVIKSLAERDWESAAEKIGTQSPRFRDCQRMHQILGSDYYHYLTYYVVESLMYPKTTMSIEAEQEQVEMAVTERNAKWIEKEIMPRLNNLETRSASLHQIEEFVKIPWMKSIAIHCLEEYSSEMRDWLKTIEGVKEKATSI
jgi:predicted transcriptional regulator